MPLRLAARVQMSVETFAPVAPVIPSLPAQPLAQAREPLPAAQIAGCMAAFGGDTFQAMSRQGRPVLGTYVRGPGPAVFISGAQHANETSGVVGALRAAQTLAARGDAHFALIASENPDGYALFNRLREQHPRHMLHASRYSALGDDIAYRERAPGGGTRDHQHVVTPLREQPRGRGAGRPRPEHQDVRTPERRAAAARPAHLRRREPLGLSASAAGT